MRPLPAACRPFVTPGPYAARTPRACAAPQAYARPVTQPPAAASADAELRKGTLYGVAAYAIWGTFPLYFHALKPSGPWEILAHRIVWTLVFCGLIPTIRRDWGGCGPPCNPRLLGGLTVAALVIAVPTGSSTSSRSCQDAPMRRRSATSSTRSSRSGSGVLVLGERLRRLQWAPSALAPSPPST